MSQHLLKPIRGWNLPLIILALAVFGLAVALHVRFWPETLVRISTDSMMVHVDFDSFWRSAAAVWSGGDIYDAGARFVNLNPPFWTVLMLPFGLMEVLPAYRIFSVLMLIVAVGSLIWMVRETRLRSFWAIAAVVLLMVSSPLLATLALGQIYPLLTLGLVAAWTLERRRRPDLSGVALGLTVAIKPSLLPVLLWPLVRQRWGMLGTAVASGMIVTLIGVITLGLEATRSWIQILLREPLNLFWDNASLPATVARLFTENTVALPLANEPWSVSLVYGLGILAVFVTAVVVRDDNATGMWALVAVSLLASPITWHNYLLLLGPGILVLLARGRFGVALVLISLQTIPPQWPLLWAGDFTAIASLGLTLYFTILVVHWIAFLFAGKEDETKHEPSTSAPDGVQSRTG